MKKILAIILAALLVPSLLAAADTLFFMQSFRLAQPSKNANSPVLEVSVQVMRPEIWKNLLQEGAALSVTCTVELLSRRSFLPNSLLGEKNYHWQLRFDPLTRDYLLVGDGQTLRHENLNTLLDSFLEDMVLPLPVHDPLEPGHTYTARLVLSLIQANVPGWMKKTLFFWSWDVAPSTVFEQEFVFEPDKAEEKP